MDENFNLAELPLHGSTPASGEKDRRVKIFRTVRASDSLQHAKPYWNGICLGTCNKSMFGMCSEGQVGRFAVANFGHKVSHGPLWIFTEALRPMKCQIQIEIFCVQHGTQRHMCC